MRARFAVVLTLSLLTVVFAKASERGQTDGVGASLCAEFTKAYAENPKEAERLYWSWATGMMSGMNMASVAASKVYRDLIADQDIMRRATRVFCTAHPLTTYSGAIVDLYVSLPLKKTASSSLRRRNRPRPAVPALEKLEPRDQPSASAWQALP